MDIEKDRNRYKLYCAVGFPLAKQKDYLDLLLRFQNLEEEDRLRYENMYKLEFKEEYQYPENWQNEHAGRVVANE